MDRHPERSGVDPSPEGAAFSARNIAADIAARQGDEPAASSDAPNNPANLIGKYLQGILEGKITDLPGGPTTDLGETKDLSMATRDLHNQLRASREQAGDHPLSPLALWDASEQLDQIVDIWKQSGMGERADLAGRALEKLIQGDRIPSTEETFNALRTQLIEHTVDVLNAQHHADKEKVQHTQHHAESVQYTQQLQTSLEQLNGILDKVPSGTPEKLNLKDKLDEVGLELRMHAASESAAIVSKQYGEWVEKCLSGEISQSEIRSTHDQLAGEIREHLPTIQAYSSMHSYEVRDDYKDPLRDKLNALHIPDNPQEAGLPDDIRERVFLVIDTIKDDINRTQYERGIHFPNNEAMWKGLSTELSQKLQRFMPPEQ